MAAVGVVAVSSRGCPIRTQDLRILWQPLLGNVLKLVVSERKKEREGGREGVKKGKRERKGEGEREREREREREKEREK